MDRLNFVTRCLILLIGLWLIPPTFAQSVGTKSNTATQTPVPATSISQKTSAATSANAPAVLPCCTQAGNTANPSWFVKIGDVIGSYLAAVAKIVSLVAILLGLTCASWWLIKILRGPVRVETLDWSVPEQFTKCGISPQAAARIVMDAANHLQRFGYQGQDAHIAFAFEKLPGDVDLELLGIKLRFLYPILVTLSGRVVQVGGAITKDGDGYLVSVWAKTPMGTPKTVNRKFDNALRSDVFKKAAELVMLMVDPVALALALNEGSPDRREETIEFLREAVRRDFPIRVGAACSLAELAEYTTNVDLCDRAIKKARSKYPLFSLPNFARILSVCDRPLRFIWNCYFARALGRLGPLQLRDGELSLAYTVRAHMCHMNWDGTSTLSGKGLEEAKDFLSQALYFDSASIPALVSMADLLFNAEKFQEAEFYYRRANALSPASAPILCKWGYNKINLNRFMEAREKFELALIENLQNDKAYQALGDLEVHQQNWEMAAKYYELASKYSMSASAFLDWGIALDNAGKLEEARWKWRKALQLSTDEDVKEEIRYRLST